ncbi:hypothetical protein F4775DRAFT_598372 [Biscogniauxia sp. FL1348]|nr:hypothetical protein F4775DRAFT_598372 [Biscogniauxia sp. FL1348]
MTTPTLPVSWTPTQAGCLRTSDYWIWEYNLKVSDARTVLGGPSQISQCFPTTWDASLTYAGTGCPAQYTSACQDSDAGVVTCCPTAYEYSCQAPTWSPGVHGEMFRCVSRYGTTGTMTVTQTDFAVNTIAVQQRRVESNLHLFALAIMYAEPVSPQSPLMYNSVIPTAATEPASSTAGLSAGQIAGIAVGVGAAVFAIGFIAWILFRRRKHHSRTHGEYPAGSGGPPSSSQAIATELESEDPIPWNEAVKGPWKIKPPN